MGRTQHTVGTANVRTSCTLLLTGNVGKPGTCSNIFRGHDIVQGATECRARFYGLAEGERRHWSRVWVNDDQPYFRDVGGKRLGSIPYSYEVNDAPHFQYGP